LPKDEPGDHEAEDIQRQHPVEDDLLHLVVSMSRRRVSACPAGTAQPGDCFGKFLGA
jgi:hypothetical protein